MNDEDIDRRLRDWGESGRRAAPEVHLPDFAADTSTTSPRGGIAHPGDMLPRRWGRARWRVPLIAAAGVIVVAVATSAVVTHGFGFGGTGPALGPGGLQAASEPGSSPSFKPPVSCAPSGDGFSLSLARDAGGQATPQKAAAYFGTHGDTPGYRAAEDEWTRIPDPNGGIEPGITLRAGDVFVHVVKLSDGSWAVDSGGHCTSTPPRTEQQRVGAATSSTSSAPEQALTGSITLPISRTPGIRSAAIVDGHLVVLAPEYLARISGDHQGRLSIVGQAKVGPPLGVPKDVHWKLVSDGRHLWAIAPNSESRLYPVDPATLRPGSPILVPQGIVDVAAMDGHLYLNTDAGVYDVAPSTTVQVRTADVMTPGGRAMAADSSRHRLLLLRDVGGRSSIVAYSPSDHEVVTSRSLPFDARAIAVAHGAIWVTGTDNDGAGPHPVLVKLDPGTLQAGGHGSIEASLTSVPMVVATGRNLWIRAPSSGDQLWCVWAGVGVQHWPAMPGILAAHAGHAFVAQGNVVGQLVLNKTCAEP